MNIEKVVTGPVAENPTNVWLLENDVTGEALIVDPGHRQSTTIEAERKVHCAP